MSKDTKEVVLAMIPLSAIVLMVGVVLSTIGTALDTEYEMQQNLQRHYQGR